MTAIETAVYATHVVFAGLPTGSVLFAALAVALLADAGWLVATSL